MLDASVTLAWFLSDEDPVLLRYSVDTLEALNAGRARAVVPASWHLEVASVLMRQVRSRLLSRREFEHGLTMLADMPLETKPAMPRVDEIARLAEQYGLQAGDALYLELSLENGLSIATLDRGLRTAAGRHRVALFQP